jgi:hypothetical protein
MINFNKHYELLPLTIKDIEIPSTCSDLLPEILSDYLCYICRFIAREPVLCSSCDEIVCSKCIQENSKRKKVCPKCNSNFIAKPIPKRIKNILDNMSIQCPNKRNCKVKTKYPFLIRDHMDTCPFTERIAICKGCQSHIETTNKLIEIENHIKICEQFGVSCPLCNLQIKRADIENHMERYCVERTVECNTCKSQVKASALNKQNGLININSEILANERDDKIDKVFNCDDIEIRITENYNISNFKEMLSFGIKRLDLSNYPINTLRLACLNNNNTLEVLNLSNTCLSDEYADILGSILSKNNTIKELNLSNNNISYKGANDIINSLKLNKYLEVLSFSGNSLRTGDLLLNIFNKLCEKKTVYNFGENLKLMLETNKTLKKLCLAECKLTSEDFNLLYQGLKSNISIKCLILTGNDINSFTKSLIRNLAILQDCKVEF